MQQRFDDRSSHTRKSAGQRIDFQQQRETHDVGCKIGTDAGSMRQNQINLQLSQVLRRDFFVGQGPKAGVNAVDRLILIDNRLHRRLGAFDILEN